MPNLTPLGPSYAWAIQVTDLMEGAGLAVSSIVRQPGETLYAFRTRFLQELRWVKKSR